MRAVLMDDYGGPEVLRVGQAERPVPCEGEMLIRVAAVGVNPADTKWRMGMLKARLKLGFPHIPGYDVAGVVEQAPPGCTAGARVAAMLDLVRQGAYAEFAVVNAAHAAPMPERLSFAAAAAVPTPGLTGVQMIEEHLNLRPGQTVLITGAVGAVGRFAMHAAHARGARVVAAVRASQVEEARRLGAEQIVVLGRERWEGPAFDHVADTVGGADVAALCRHLAPGGSIFTAATTPIPAEGLGAAPVFFAVHPDGARLAQLLEAVAAGAIVHPVSRCMKLEEAAAAHALVEAGGCGKIALVM